MTRIVADACPGVLRPHRAADGDLVRLRIPGGVTSAGAMTALAAAATRYADGTIQLTSRGNLQLRGLDVSADADEAVAELDRGLTPAVTAAGFLPSATHERVRNLVTSPLTGRSGGQADLRPLTAEVDRLLQGSPTLAGLPGRFLFVLDDGRGDVLKLRPDLGVRATTADRGRLLVGDLIGPEVDLAGAPAEIVSLAEKFVDLGTTAWQVRELPGQGRELRADLSEWSLPIPADPPSIGLLQQDDGRWSAVLTMPFGVLNEAQVGAIAGVAGFADGVLIVTPWRTIVIPDLPTVTAGMLETLESAGLVLNEESPWTAVTACTGSPGCAKGAADVRGLLARALNQKRAVEFSMPNTPVHVVACGRRCGSPAGRHLEVLAGEAALIASIDGRTWQLDSIEDVFDSTAGTATVSLSQRDF